MWRESPWPSRCIFRMSPWLVRVGSPVLGPIRCTSMITTGISAKYARPTNSDMSEIPGPDVAVSALAPAQPAPMAMPTAASSSSACTTAKVRLPSALTRCFLRNSSAYSARLLDGVIGYQVSTLAPPKSAPSAAALFPSIRIFSCVESIRST